MKKDDDQWEDEVYLLMAKEDTRIGFDYEPDQKFMKLRFKKKVILVLTKLATLLGVHNILRFW